MRADNSEPRFNQSKIPKAQAMSKARNPRDQARFLVDNDEIISLAYSFKDPEAAVMMPGDDQFENDPRQIFDYHAMTLVDLERTFSPKLEEYLAGNTGFQNLSKALSKFKNGLEQNPAHINKSLGQLTQENPGLRNFTFGFMRELKKFEDAVKTDGTNRNNNLAALTAFNLGFIDGSKATETSMGETTDNPATIEHLENRPSASPSPSLPLVIDLSGVSSKIYTVLNPSFEACTGTNIGAINAADMGIKANPPAAKPGFFQRTKNALQARATAFLGEDRLPGMTLNLNQASFTTVAGLSSAINKAVSAQNRTEVNEILASSPQSLTADKINKIKNYNEALSLARTSFATKKPVKFRLLNHHFDPMYARSARKIAMDLSHIGPKNPSEEAAQLKEMQTDPVNIPSLFFAICTLISFKAQREEPSGDINIIATAPPIFRKLVTEKLLTDRKWGQDLETLCKQPEGYFAKLFQELNIIKAN